MRILLDHCVDIHFIKHIVGHDVSHTKEMGWQALSNGKLLAAAEAAGFDVMLTVDKNVRHQQNFSKRQISLITLSPILVDMIYLEPLVPQLLALLSIGIVPGTETVIKP